MKFFQYGFFIFSLFLFAFKSFATENLSSKLSSLSQGESFQQEGSEYTIYPELEAQLTKKTKPETIKENKPKTMSQTAASEQTVGYIENFAIVRKAQLSPQSLRSNTTTENKFKNAVVFDKKRNKFGLMSGDVILKMKDGHYRFKKIPQNQTIQKTIDDFKNEANVEKATVEVNENFQRPM